MAPFSLFVLALYVLLQSAPVFKWFTVDPKFLAFVGIVFVIAVVVETFFWVRNGNHVWFKHNA